MRKKEKNKTGKKISVKNIKKNSENSDWNEYIKKI